MMTKVKLRQRPLPSGRISLYLDFYPAIQNPVTGKMSRREYLGIMLNANPKTQAEKFHYKELLATAEAIRAKRELSIINQQYGFIDKSRDKIDFIEYFRNKTLNRQHYYKTTLDHFINFTNNHCKMGDINETLCQNFIDWLKRTTAKTGKRQMLSQNAVKMYYTVFKHVISLAHREKLIDTDFSKSMEKVKGEEVHKEYLTIEEVRKLYATPCTVKDLKEASLFSILTGLRVSDIINLKWEDFVTYPDGGKAIKITTIKTKANTLNPITDEAYQICGKPSKGTVFPNLSPSKIQRHLQEWIAEAGIDKKITFHCFRHTFATLLVTSGKDIFTISKLLTHKSLQTTMIYAEATDEHKRDVAEAIKINLKLNTTAGVGGYTN